MRNVITGICVLGLAVMPVPAAAEDHWVVRTQVVGNSPACDLPGPDRQLSRIGPLRVNTSPTLAKAIARYGQPQRVKESSTGQQATVTWSGRFAAKMYFVSFGGVNNIKQLPLQYAVLTGRGWETQRGLTVGASFERMYRVYGNEAWPQDPRYGGHGNWWRLAGGCTPCIGTCPTDPTDSNVLNARIRAGRIVAFYAAVGAAGE